MHDMATFIEYDGQLACAFMDEFACYQTIDPDQIDLPDLKEGQSYVFTIKDFLQMEKLKRSNSFKIKLVDNTELKKQYKPSSARVQMQRSSGASFVAIHDDEYGVVFREWLPFVKATASYFGAKRPEVTKHIGPGQAYFVSYNRVAGREDPVAQVVDMSALSSCEVVEVTQVNSLKTPHGSILVKKEAISAIESGKTSRCSTSIDVSGMKSTGVTSRTARTVDSATAVSFRLSPDDDHIAAQTSSNCTSKKETEGSSCGQDAHEVKQLNIGSERLSQILLLLANYDESTFKQFASQQWAKTIRPILKFQEKITHTMPRKFACHRKVYLSPWRLPHMDAWVQGIDYFWDPRDIILYLKKYGWGRVARNELKLIEDPPDISNVHDLQVLARIVPNFKPLWDILVESGWVKSMGGLYIPHWSLDKYEDCGSDEAFKAEKDMHENLDYFVSEENVREYIEIHGDTKEASPTQISYSNFTPATHRTDDSVYYSSGQPVNAEISGGSRASGLADACSASASKTAASSNMYKPKRLETAMRRKTAERIKEVFSSSSGFKESDQYFKKVWPLLSSIGWRVLGVKGKSTDVYVAHWARVPVRDGVDIKSIDVTDLQLNVEYFQSKDYLLKYLYDFNDLRQSACPPDEFSGASASTPKGKKFLRYLEEQLAEETVDVDSPQKAKAGKKRKTMKKESGLSETSIAKTWSFQRTAYAAVCEDTFTVYANNPKFSVFPRLLPCLKEAGFHECSIRNKDLLFKVWVAPWTRLQDAAPAIQRIFDSEMVHENADMVPNVDFFYDKDDLLKFLYMIIFQGGPQPVFSSALSIPDDDDHGRGRTARHKNVKSFHDFLEQEHAQYHKTLGVPMPRDSPVATPFSEKKAAKGKQKASQMDGRGATSGAAGKLKEPANSSQAHSKARVVAPTPAAREADADPTPIHTDYKFRSIQHKQDRLRQLLDKQDRSCPYPFFDVVKILLAEGPLRWCSFTVPETLLVHYRIFVPGEKLDFDRIIPNKKNAYRVDGLVAGEDYFDESQKDELLYHVFTEIYGHEEVSAMGRRRRKFRDFIIDRNEKRWKEESIRRAEEKRLEEERRWQEVKEAVEAERQAARALKRAKHESKREEAGRVKSTETPGAMSGATVEPSPIGSNYKFGNLNMKESRLKKLFNEFQRNSPYLFHPVMTTLLSAPCQWYYFSVNCEHIYVPHDKFDLTRQQGDSYDLSGLEMYGGDYYREDMKDEALYKVFIDLFGHTDETRARRRKPFCEFLLHRNETIPMSERKRKHNRLTCEDAADESQAPAAESTGVKKSVKISKKAVASKKEKEEKEVSAKAEEPLRLFSDEEIAKNQYECDRAPIRVDEASLEQLREIMYKRDADFIADWKALYKAACSQRRKLNLGDYGQVFAELQKHNTKWRVISNGYITRHPRIRRPTDLMHFKEADGVHYFSSQQALLRFVRDQGIANGANVDSLIEAAGDQGGNDVESGSWSGSERESGSESDNMSVASSVDYSFRDDDHDVDGDGSGDGSTSQDQPFVISKKAPLNAIYKADDITSRIALLTAQNEICMSPGIVVEDDEEDDDDDDEDMPVLGTQSPQDANQKVADADDYDVKSPMESVEAIPSPPLSDVSQDPVLAELEKARPSADMLLSILKDYYVYTYPKKNYKFSYNPLTTRIIFRKVVDKFADDLIRNEDYFDDDEAFIDYLQVYYNVKTESTLPQDDMASRTMRAAKVAALQATSSSATGMPNALMSPDATTAYAASHAASRRTAMGSEGSDPGADEAKENDDGTDDDSDRTAPQDQSQEGSASSSDSVASSIPSEDEMTSADRPRSRKTKRKAPEPEVTEAQSKRGLKSAARMPSCSLGALSSSAKNADSKMDVEADANNDDDGHDRYDGGMTNDENEAPEEPNLLNLQQAVDHAQIALRAGSTQSRLFGREQEFENLFEQIATAIERNEGKGIFLMGLPGQGKTLVTDMVLKELQERTRFPVNSNGCPMVKRHCRPDRKHVALAGDGNMLYRIIKIKGTSLTPETYVYIAQELGMGDSIGCGEAKRLVMAQLRKERGKNKNSKSRTMTILVVDEIDKAPESDRSELYSIALHPASSLILVGLGNNFNLNDKGFSSSARPECITFAPYGSEQLESILSARTFGTFRVNAAQFLCKKVAGITGDVRTLFGLASECLKDEVEDMKKNDVTISDCPPQMIVGLKLAVQTVQRTIGKDQIIERIGHISANARLFLVSLFLYDKGVNNSAKLNDLHLAYDALLGEKHIAQPTQSDTRRCIDELTNARLIIGGGNKGYGRNNQSNAPYLVNVSIDRVMRCKALEQWARDKLEALAQTTLWQERIRARNSLERQN